MSINNKSSCYKYILKSNEAGLESPASLILVSRKDWAGLIEKICANAIDFCYQ
jgi:hypothetical protein